MTARMAVLGYLPVLATGIAGIFAFLDGRYYACAALLAVSGVYGERWMERLEEQYRESGSERARRGT